MDTTREGNPQSLASGMEAGVSILILMDTTREDGRETLLDLADSLFQSSF